MHVSIWSFNPLIQHVYSPSDMPLMCHQKTGRPGAPHSATAVSCTHVLTVVTRLLTGVMSSASGVHALQRTRLQTAGGSPQPASTGPPAAPSPVRVIAGSPGVEPISAQAIRRTGSNAAAAGLMSTAKTRGSTRTTVSSLGCAHQASSCTRTAAQPGGFRRAAAQPNGGRAGQLCRAPPGLLEHHRPGQGRTSCTCPSSSGTCNNQSHSTQQQGCSFHTC